ncbi:MAG: hypothetical protein R3C01_10245 [Planctomycetaceae bacterium]
MHRLPGSFTAVCVISLVLAILGSMVTCAGAFTTIFQDQIVNAGGGVNAPPQAVIDLQQDWLPVQILFLIWRGVTVILLLIGSIMGLNKALAARTWLLAAVTCGLIFELANIGPHVWLQLKTMDIMKAELLGKAGGPPEGFFTAAVGVGIAVSVGTVLVKVAFYIWGHFVLRNKQVVAAFSGTADDEDEPQDEWS